MIEAQEPVDRPQPITDSQPPRRVLGLLTSAQQNERVGPPDPETGVVPTRLEQWQRDNPDMTVLPRMGSDLPEEARKANDRIFDERRALVRAGKLASAAALAGGLIYAVVAHQKRKAQNSGSSK